MSLPAKTLELEITMVVSRIIEQSSGRRIQVTPDDLLIEDGIIDSLAMVDLVTTLESSYGVALLAADLTPENFGSAVAISRLISARRA